MNQIVPSSQPSFSRGWSNTSLHWLCAAYLFVSTATMVIGQNAWTNVATTPTGAVGLGHMLLLTDGTVMAENSNNSYAQGSRVQISVAAPAVITWTAHGLAANTLVFFGTTQSLPTGLIAGNPYFVIAAGLTANTFQVSANPGGVAVNTSGAQSGTHTAQALPIVQISVAAPGVITWTAHGLAANTQVQFVTSGSLPTGLTANTAYYVHGGASLTANTFQVSAAPDGAAINTSGTQSGTHYILATRFGPEWYRLTPDASGSYANGTWSTLSSMASNRIHFASQILTDGRVLVAGGEQGAGIQGAELFDPITNTWTATPAPTAGQNLSDANSVILPDGRVIVAVVDGDLQSTRIYTPVAGGAGAWAAWQSCTGIHNETAWVKLADDSVLFADRGPDAGPVNVRTTERYRPDQNNTWLADTALPDSVSLYDTNYEPGPGMLLPNGNVIMIGATGETAIYTPGASHANGHWAAGQTMGAITHADGTTAMAQAGMPDAPAAIMPNGRILCLVSPPNTLSGQATGYLEYDYNADVFAQVTNPSNANDTAPNHCEFKELLVLPDGNLLYSDGTTQLAVYGAGRNVPAGHDDWRPTISAISANLDGSNNITSYHLTGNRLTGISEGSCFGDDWQNATNYPIVRLTSVSDSTKKYYARSTNWRPRVWAAGATNQDITLANCNTTNGLITVTCDSTAGLEVGMTVTGTNIAITGPRTTVATVPDSTSFTLSSAATGGGGGITLTAADRGVDFTLPSITLASCSFTPGSATVTCNGTTTTTGLSPGMVIGPISGISVPGSTISSVINNTQFVLSANPIVTGSNVTLTASYFTEPSMTLSSCTTTNNTTTVTCPNTAGLAAGLFVTGAPIPPGTTIASVTNTTSFVLSANATNSSTINVLTFSAINPAIGSEYTVEVVANGIPSASSPPFGINCPNGTSSVSTLSQLAIDGVNISGFSTDQTIYAATVGTTFTVTPTASRMGAVISIALNGTTEINNLSSGSTSAALTPQNGAVGDTVTITVTAPDGNHSSTYTVKINDTTAPTVTSVKLASGFGGLYRLNGVVNLEVTMSEPVIVAGGAPTLSLNAGSTAKAIYTGIDSTQTVLTFQYTVAASDLSNALDYKDINSLTLPAGPPLVTIRDFGGNNLNTTLPTLNNGSSVSPGKLIAINGSADMNVVAFNTSTPAPLSTSTGSLPFSSLTIYFPNFNPALGQSVTLVNNTSSNAISGSFSNLPDGGVLQFLAGGHTYSYFISYTGGDGNDVTLRRAYWESDDGSCAITQILPDIIPNLCSPLVFRGNGFSTTSKIQSITLKDTTNYYPIIPIFDRSVSAPTSDNEISGAFIYNMIGGSLSLQVNNQDALVLPQPYYSASQSTDQWPTQRTVKNGIASNSDAYGISAIWDEFIFGTQVNPVLMSEKGRYGLIAGSSTTADDFQFMGKRWDHYSTSVPSNGTVEGQISPFLTAADAPSLANSIAPKSAVAGVMIRAGDIMSGTDSVVAWAPYVMLARTGDGRIVLLKRNAANGVATLVASVQIPSAKLTSIVTFRLERAATSTSGVFKAAYSWDRVTWNSFNGTGWVTTAVTSSGTVGIAFGQPVSAGIAVASGAIGTSANILVWAWRAARTTPYLSAPGTLPVTMGGSTYPALTPVSLKFDSTGSFLWELAADGSGALYVVKYGYTDAATPTLTLLSRILLNSSSGQTVPTYFTIPNSNDCFAVSTLGQLFLTDTVPLIRSINPVTGDCSLVAGGGGDSGYSPGIGGVYVDPLTINFLTTTSTIAIWQSVPDFVVSGGVAASPFALGSLHAQPSGGLDRIFGCYDFQSSNHQAIFQDFSFTSPNPGTGDMPWNLLTNRAGCVYVNEAGTISIPSWTIVGKFGSVPGVRIGITNFWVYASGDGKVATDSTLRLMADQSAVNESGDIFMGHTWGSPGGPLPVVPTSGTNAFVTYTNSTAAFCAIRNIDHYDGVVRRVAGTGARVTLPNATNAMAGPALTIPLNSASMLVVDRQGTLLFMDGSGFRWLKD